ncbi:MAG: protease pro-enzyme activation domain-containing protein [Candidatus Sulfotelmatobacter sp.]
MRSWKFLLPLLASSLCFAAQPDRIAGTINSSQVVALAKSLHPKAQPQYDQGLVDPSLKLSYVTMLMAPSPTQQRALTQLLAQQQDPKSANYHKWLTPQQFADQFGLSQNDLNKVTAWLQSQGFQILSLGGSRNSIAFSGTAAQAQSAFKAEIHNYKVDGEVHFANSTPLMIPSALGGIVSSVMGLHSFFPKPASQVKGRGGMKNSHPAYYDSEFVFPNFLAPDDIATIYDITPLYNASTAIDGSGQTLGIIGQTDVYLADINDFRSGFNLNQITGCTTSSSGIITACNSTYFRYVLVGSDPGAPSTCGDLSEADLDIEWSGAVARDAQIIFFNSPLTFNADCTEITNGNGGVNAALTTAIDPSSGSPLAPVLSMSYGACEAGAGNLETLLQQGNAEGITIMNSAGDQGAAACDFSPPNNAVNPPFSPAVNGLAVSYPASSPEVTGVGGTSISLANDSYPTQSSYWSTTLGPNGGTAVSYIPELPWNDDETFATYCHAPASGDDFCLNGNGTTDWVALPTTATAAQVQTDIWIAAGGGGASNCFYENSSDVCLGAGAGPSGGGLAQPAYQQSLAVPGAPAGVRYVPDVSLLASPNFPGYIYCTPISELENSTSTSSSCAGGIANALNNGSYLSAIGGTSASTPIFAGIVTLLKQYLGSTSGLGNINPKLYAMAGDPSYSAFHAVTSGDNDVYCEPSAPADFPANVICPASGVFGFSAANFDPTTGYNLVTGLGSVDVNALATDWADSLIPTTTSLVSSTNQTAGGLNVTLTATVGPSSAAGSVRYYVNGSTTALGMATLSSGTAALVTNALPTGTDSVTATYVGLNAPSTSPSVSITVTQPDFSFTTPGNLSPSTIPAGQSAATVLTLTPVNGAGIVNFTSSSCTGLPGGALCSFNPSSVSFGGVTPNGTTTVTVSTAPNMTTPTTVSTITVTGTVSTGGATHSVNLSSANPTLTINATNETFTIAPTNGTATFSVAPGATAQVPISVTGTNGFIVTSTPPATATTVLPVTYTCLQSSIPSEANCTFSPGSGNAISNTSLSLSIATTAPTSQLRPPLGHGSRIFYALLLPCLFGIVFAAGSRTRTARLLSLIVVLGFSTLWLGSCSSGNGGSTGGQSNPGTPAGTYPVVVNATTAGPNPLTSTFTVNLTVQ